MSIARSSSKLFLVNILNALIGFAAITLFARELGPTGIGVYFLFQALMQVFGASIDLGLNTAMEKRLSEGANRESILGGGIVIKIAGFTTVCLIVAAFRGQIDGYVGAPTAWLLIAGLAVSQVATIATTSLRGELRVGETAVLSLANQVGYVVLGGALVIWLGWGPVGLIYGTIAGSVASAVWGVAKLDTRPVVPSRETVMSLLSYTKYNTIPALGTQAHNWADVLIIGFLLTQADVGTYEVAWRIAVVSLLFPRALGITLLPQASSLSARGERGRVTSLVSNAFFPAVALVIPAVFGTLVLADEILGVLFGPAYATAGLVLIILIAGKIPEALQTIVGRVLLGIDRPDLTTRATVVATVLNVVLNLALIPLFGLVGAAVATTLAYTVGMLMRAWYLHRLIGFDFPVGNVVRVTAVSAVMAGVLAAVQSVVPVTDIVRLFAMVGVGGVVFTLGVVSLPTLRAQLGSYAKAIRRG